MSSPKRASKPAPKSKPAAKPAKVKTAAKVADKPAAKSKAAPAAAASNGSASGDATRLAAEIERELAGGKLDTLTPQALHALMSACCKNYATRIEAGEDLLPLSQRTTVSPTEVMVTASGLLRAANLAVFELGMWQSWTGR
jgi:predicted component of type VI protein secretion system